MTEPKRPLKVFLCHAHADRDAVKALYDRLTKDGVDAWLDKEKLLPGQDWELEIPKAVRSADAIIICLSNKSVTKEGYVQKEIRFALDVADEKPDGTIYLIPVRLEPCELPSRLARWQWVDLFSSDGYRRLRISLRLRADSVGATLASSNRKSEMVDFPVRDYSNPSNSPSTREGNSNFSLVGRLLVLISVIVVCTAMYWLGRGVINMINQAPLPTTVLPVSTTPVLLTETPFNTPIQIPPSLTPSGTFFAPLIMDTVPPTQVVLPTFTLTPSATAFPEPPMALIPGGTFVMGRDSGQNDEAPPHTIFVDSFYMDQYLVTNDSYHYCDLSGVCQYPPNNSSVPNGYYGVKYPNYPVLNVSWQMAKTYCEWRGGRLPTEAEWEKAARGGLAGMLYPWGNESPICDADSRNGAQFAGCSEKGTVKVGVFSPNGYRLYDMVGNVWEWISDWYLFDYYAQPDAGLPNPQGPPSGERRVLRGASWAEDGASLYVANRGSAPPETQDNKIGFRCVKDVP